MSVRPAGRHARERSNVAAPSRRFVVAVLVATAAAVLSPIAAAGPDPKLDPPKKYYLALGDSVAYGFQLSKFLADRPPIEYDTGYVDLFAARLREIRPELALVNYGCPGESTSSFMTGPCLFSELGNKLHDDYEGSQLDAAIAFLRAHRGRVSPITVTLWGNDVREFVASCGGDFSCIQAEAPAEIVRLTSRLTAILRPLRAEAPEAEIIVTGPWNTSIGFFSETHPLFHSLSTAMSEASAAGGARFADLLPVFNPQGDPDTETAMICALTLICTEADSHPSDLGYRTIADAVFEASGYGRIGSGPSDSPPH
jgi:lysophospholipase L1-like esterase